MGWRFRLSDKTVRKFAELPIYHIQKCSPGNEVSGSIRFMQIFEGVRWRGASNESGVVKMAIFASFVHCLPNILHTWPHNSFQVIRLSMTLSIFQGHWTLSHQISQKRCVIRCDSWSVGLFDVSCFMRGCSVFLYTFCVYSRKLVHVQ